MPKDGDDLLAEQIAYYRAKAPEYEQHAIPWAEHERAQAALDAFRPSGRVLELACGPGAWTERLARHASELLAVDASPEMLARARARVGDDARVRFEEADLFSYRPTGTWNVVFFGFWLSHVPMERFEAFWDMVAAALAPGGRVFFVDDAFRTEEELVEGVDSSTIQRRLLDGRTFRAVKVPHDAAVLEQRLRGLGWDVRVTASDDHFYWGEGRRAG